MDIKNTQEKLEEIRAEREKLQQRLKELAKETSDIEKTLAMALGNSIPEHYPINSQYFSVNPDTGCLWLTRETNVDVLMRYLAFKTEKIAALADEKSLFLRKLAYFKELFDKEYKPNWEDRDEHKFAVYYDHCIGEYAVNNRMCCEIKSHIYFSTKEIAQKCADWLNETEEK